MTGPKWGRGRLGATVVCLTALISACGGGRPVVHPAEIPAPVVGPAPAPLPWIDRRLLDTPSLDRFYAALGYRRAWARDSTTLLEVLAGAADDGLDPEDYAPPATEDPSLRDIGLTRAALRYAHDLSLGRVVPAAIDSLWRGESEFDPDSAVLAVLTADRVADLAVALRPPQPGYAALRQFVSGPDAALVGLNLERWRWLPRNLGVRYLMVNVPAAEVLAVERGFPVLVSRAVVGRPDWPTPMVAGTADRLVFSPTWTVPPGIVKAELLPAARRDSAWLSRHGYEVWSGMRLADPDTIAWATLPERIALRFRYVLPPGPANPLGAVKLPFPNRFSVGLHDTPERGLFADSLRTFSHGCVRVERMADLAAWLLEPTGWSADSVAAFLYHGGERDHAVLLGTPVPIYLTYFTASVDPAGRLVRHPDPYGWDSRLEAALGDDDASPKGTSPRRNLHGVCEEAP